MNTTRAAIATFVVVFLAAVATGAIVGSLTAEEPPEASEPSIAPDNVEIDNPQYDADRVSPDSTPGEATVEMSSSEQNKTVLIHAGSSVRERDIQSLVNVLIHNGHNVVIKNEAPSLGPGPGPIFRTGSEQIGPPRPGPGPSPGLGQSLGNLLEDAHGFISLGVDSYDDEGLNSITEFIENDGRVIMGVNPSQSFSFTGHAETYSELGMYTEPGYVYNLDENDLNYQRIYVEPSGESMLTEGVDRAMFATATPVNAEGVNESLVPIEGTELSETRDSTDLPVLVRTGDVVLMGDTTFMKPHNVRRADNDVFVGNVADFLVSGDRVTREELSNGDDGEVVTVAVGPDGEPTFEPMEVEIEPGTTVRFEWESDGYNLVPAEKPPESDWEGVPETKDEGYTYEHTFDVEGVFVVISEPHQEEGMVAGILVGNPNS